MEDYKGEAVYIKLGLSVALEALEAPLAPLVYPGGLLGHQCHVLILVLNAKPLWNSQ
jgi:hypothetical protein